MSYKRKVLSDIKCDVCKNYYTPNRSHQRYCSRKCRNQHYKNDYAIQKATGKLGGWMSIRWKILVRDKFRCQYCGRGVEDGIKLQVDHIKPISKGGINKEENLKTACLECNLGKSNSTIG